MGESMLFLVLLAGCVIYGIDRKRRERKGALRRAALWMEQSPAVPADMDAVKDWWQAVAAERTAAWMILPGRTWTWTQYSPP